MSKSKTSGKLAPRAPNLQIPEDMYDLLTEFCEKHPNLSKADVARAGLSRFLPELADGTALIINGKLVYRDEIESSAA